MRALLLSSLLFALPMAAQSPRMIKVDIIQKSEVAGHKSADGPGEVHVRMPITLIKGFIGAIDEHEIKVNGKAKKGVKLDQLVKMLEQGKSGDLLLEVTTDKGDLVKITLE